MSSPADVIISQLQAISQLFSSYSSSRVKMVAGQGEMFIRLKLDQNPSEMDARTFARIKNVIWDQLLATKAEIFQS